MTLSNGNNIRVTGHLCGELTGPGEFPAQRLVTRSFDVFFDLSLNKRLSKQSRGCWFETQSHPLWRHCNCPEVMYISTRPDILKISTHFLRYLLSMTKPDKAKNKNTFSSAFNIHDLCLSVTYIINVHVTDAVISYVPWHVNMFLFALFSCHAVDTYCIFIIALAVDQQRDCPSASKITAYRWVSVRKT